VLNSVGPVTRFFTLENTVPLGTITIDATTGDAPTIHTIQGRTIDMSWSTFDEVDIDQLAYNVYDFGGSKGVSRFLSISGLPPVLQVDVPHLIVSDDDFSKTFKSAPTTYEIRIQGFNDATADNRPGPVFRTIVQFKFLTNLAIYAPWYNETPALDSVFDTLAATNSTWMGRDEMIDTVTYLYDNVSIAGTKRIFDFTGGVVVNRKQGNTGDPFLDTIGGWVSQTTSNGTTDVLVIFDAMPDSIFDDADSGTTLIQKYLDSADPSSTGNTRDGDVVVWVGPKPFVWVIGPNGVRKLATDLPDASSDLGLTTIFSGAFLKNGDAKNAPTDAHRTMLLTPDMLASTDLPSMFPYNPVTAFDGLAGDPSDVVLYLDAPNGIGALGAAINWNLEEAFSAREIGFGNYPSSGVLYTVDFAARQQTSAGVFASFLSYGPAGPVTDINQNGNRHPAPHLGPVIEEFLRGYVLNPGDNVINSRRIYYQCKDCKADMSGNSASSGLFDVAYWPDANDKNVNITKVTAAGANNQSSALEGTSAAKIALVRSKNLTDADGSFSASNASAFLYRDDAFEFEQKSESFPVTGGDISDSGTHITLRTRANIAVSPDGSVPLTEQVIFYKASSQSAIAVTTDTGAGVGTVQEPVLDSTGRYLAFSSRDVYSTQNYLGNGFANQKVTDDNQIYRYDGQGVGDKVFQDGAVTLNEFADPPVPLLGATSRCEKPRVLAGGRFVAFIADNASTAVTPTNSRKQLMLAYLLNPGLDNWKIGFITASTDGRVIDFDMSGDLVTEIAPAKFPYLVFESNVDYSGNYVHLEGSGLPKDISPSFLDSIEGAAGNGQHGDLDSVSGNPVHAIYLFAANTNRKIFRLAIGNDGDCIAPRISPDGQEVVFKSHATRVTGAQLYDGTTYVTQTVENPSGAWAVFRISLRAYDSPEKKRQAIIQLVSPPGLDVGEVRNLGISN